MLVLSRQTNEKIVFPQLAISVEVLRIGENAVRLGVEAPREVRILRDELVDLTAPPAEPAAPQPALREMRHALRNLLNQFSLGLHLAQMQLEEGEYQDANKTIADLLA